MDKALGGALRERLEVRGEFFQRRAFGGVGFEAGVDGVREGRRDAPVGPDGFGPAQDLLVGIEVRIGLGEAPAAVFLLGAAGRVEIFSGVERQLVGGGLVQGGPSTQGTVDTSDEAAMIVTSVLFCGMVS